jgi:phage shock protein C
MNCPSCRREIADYSNFCYFCGAKQHIAPSGAPPIQKRLMRSVTDSKIAGVCGGIAEYLEIDSTIVRLVWVLAVIVPVPLVPAILGYFVAWLIMPLPPLAAAVPQPAAPPATSAQTAQSA